MAIRYRKSAEPIRTDGRDIDREIASLSGEAATQKASGSSDKHIASIAQPWRKLPEPEHSAPTYYDRPLLKEPIWEWAIPTYYYVGGLTGASLVLGAAAQLAGSTALRLLVRRCRKTGFAGVCLSGALLIYDLGRPWRFFNMLRVFRPTSPMNMGAWILCGTGAAATGAVLLPEDCALSTTCGIAAGLFGLGLATYTGVLVANSAIPLWYESRRVLPVLFSASAAASAGCALAIFPTQDAGSIPKSFGIAGQLLEIAAGVMMEKQAAIVPRVASPLRHGFSGFLWRTSALLTATSLVVGMTGRSRRKQTVAGVLGTFGSLLLRFAIQHAGVVSSRDARASFDQQRAQQR
ncbi:MAG TPA: NrfD/PsrC family molybdoenzyme membrane anchor subunit [Bryobacteraceae bacterium]|jgi:formate-dependent nitrite reductase membrane component NrfD